MFIQSHPALHRTNTKGMPFIGRCPACGKEGLALTQMSEPCVRSEKSQDEFFIQAVTEEQK